MPDVNTVAQSHDATQMLFYFVCVLGAAIGGAVFWFSKWVVIPLRDVFMDYMKNQATFAASVNKALSEAAPDRQRAHNESLARFDKLDAALAKILQEINIPPN